MPDAAVKRASIKDCELFLAEDIGSISKNAKVSVTKAYPIARICIGFNLFNKKIPSSFFLP
jgi:hypothetical protein